MFNTTGDNGEKRGFPARLLQCGRSVRPVFVQHEALWRINVTPCPQMAIAEIRFMRALAYRFLVMNWGRCRS